MANYRKSFNLRNGVQVDEDNFLVNANGLVGIGTSVPTETLDVRGSVKVVGVVTASSVYTPNMVVTGVTTLTQLNVGITSIKSGIITASSGIITYYGDGSGLVNIPTSQWVDVNPGTGYSSIYAAGTVGIATTMPYYFLQVGGNPDVTNGIGIGINSTGDVKTTGIVTAAIFSGSGIGITQINASNIESGTLSNNRLPTIDNSKLPSNISVSGVITATTFVGNLTGNVTGSLTGIAQSASSLTGIPNISVGVITATRIITDTIDVISSPAGVTTVATTLNVGTGGTGFTALNTGRVGVGTAIPTSEFQIRKPIATLLEVVSDTSSARISVGQSVGAGKSTAVLRFGDTLKNFDIINNDTGSINMYLHNGPSGVGTGRFSWIYGQNNNELVSLTYNGNFGIGITNPSSNLHVVGTSTVTGNANFGSNVTITGNLVAGSISLPSVISGSNLNNSSGVSTVTNLLVAPVGVGSIGINTTDAIAGLDARAVDGLFNRIGINTSSFGTELLNVNGASRFGSIGIGTAASTTGIGLVITNEIQQFNSTTTLTNSILYVAGTSGVGIGTTSVRAALDCADAGKINPGLLPGEGTGSRAYFLPPRLTNTQRTGLTTEAGAIIYNTSTNKHQGWNGTTWNDLY